MDSLPAPFQGVSNEAFGERTLRFLDPTPVTDADGTSRFYYGVLDRPDSYFPCPRYETMAAIRNVDLHFHMRQGRQGCCMAETFDPRSDNTELPSMFEFRCECPIWHFVGPGGPKPALTIFVERFGEGGLGIDYEVMLNMLLGVMQTLPGAGFENVVVRVAKVPIGELVAPVRATEFEMRVLRCRFEDQMGEATVVDEGDVCRMEFCPRDFVERRRGQFPLVEMAPDLYRARAYVRESRMAAAERSERGV